MLERLTAFPTLGNVNSRAPSDTQLAVGPDYIIQMINISGQIYDKAGNAIGSPFDLGAFFGFTAGTGTDPRVHYDAAAGRFYACYEANRSGGDEIQLAVSDDGDPNGTWTRYNVGSNTSNVLQDQPKLGYTNDKVTLSWNNYDNSMTDRPFLGVETVVVNKAELLAQGTITFATFAQDANQFQVVPATSLSSVNDQLTMSHDTNSTDVQVLTITGVPGVSPVNQSETTIAIGTADTPPDAEQPSGGDSIIETNDDRMLSVAWQNDHLWGVFNVACIPPGDTVTRACQRFIQINTAGGGRTLATNHNLGLNGGHIYYGSVALNDENDLFAGFTASFTGIFAGGVAIGVPQGNFPAVLSGDFYAAGDQAYTCACDTASKPANRRWGDYSGIARDPANPKDVWTVQQIGGLSTGGTPFGGPWGTAMDRVTLSPPTVTGVIPNRGPERSTCTNTVTVTGTEFPTSGTSVKFGTATSPSVSVTGPNSLTAAVPPQPAGTVDVTVTTPNGTSPVTAADRYTYDADTAAPTAGASLSPAANGAGWNTTSPTIVNITADDSCGSGVQKITYSAAGAQAIPSTDASGAVAAVPVTAEGTTTVTFTATDNATNPSSRSVTYTVAYRICLLYDPTQPPRGGQSTMPIRLRICDANGNNLSSPAITLTPSQIVGPAIRPFTTPFRYDAGLRGYIVNVPTRDLPGGSYNLQFTISGADTTTHVAPFTLR
ncbi:IPT/TIG domain-containing protein [Streptomyces sp. NPDC086023]|uniref:IPT/TIG domain-containing protein n=1 Tax=Streptomyces sp. NPDC086023 TaxID=3365746 RepID=UPI0037D44187